MKHYKEVANNIFARREQFEAEKARKRGLLVKTLTPACCACLVALLGVGLWQSGLLSPQPPQTVDDAVTPGTKDWYGPGEEEPTVSQKPTDPQKPPKDEAPVGGDADSEGDRDSFSKAVAIGAGFSAKEIEDYIAKNKQNILQIVQAEYDFEIQSAWVNKQGYCHASCGDQNEVNLDYITLPILVNGKMYAGVTLTKTAEGELLETVNIGGETWKHYNDTIFDDPKAEIVFAFLPNAMGEIMILPNNTAVSPVDGNVQNPIAALNPGIKWYDLLKTEYNTVTGEALLAAQNNVVLL